MDIMALIGGDTPLRKTASTHGGEWCGPCPFCGGRDRFRVQPIRGRWWCRMPSPAWQSSASRAALLCEQQLWTSRGERARTWLKARGLMDETLRRWTIGYTWGQSIEALWVPRGIVLPYLFGRDHLIGHETLVLSEGEFDAMLLW